MLKVTASLKKDDSNTEKNANVHPKALQPSAKSLEKIMQFAATYRVEKIANDQFVELFIN
jgi:hypothetical protein